MKNNELKTIDNKIIFLTDEESIYLLAKKITDRLMEEKENKKEWLTLIEVKALLGVKSSTTIQKLRDNSSIRFCKFGRKILYDRMSITEYLEKNVSETF
jgi:hypothetical protein